MAQLHPPERAGLRGAPFPSQNPPPDLRSYGEGPAWDAKPPPGIEPLEMDLRNAVTAMDHMAILLGQVKSACS